jgi:hypothetical protein
MLQEGRPAPLFYPLGHPAPYAHDFFPKSTNFGRLRSVGRRQKRRGPAVVLQVDVDAVVQQQLDEVLPPAGEGVEERAVALAVLGVRQVLLPFQDFDGGGEIVFENSLG